MPQRHEESFTSIDSPSLQFLPRQQEAAGWQLEQDPIVVPADRLRDYLDRQLPRFAAYGIVDVTAGSYKATAGDGFAIVEIFRFPDFVKAFGAYSLQKEGPIRYVDLVNEAFTAKHSVHLWRGPFYVRVTGGGNPDASQALLHLAGTVADRMPPAPGKPAVLNFLPVANRVPNSEAYSATGGFGLPFLANSFQASYDIDGARIEGLIIPAASPAAAAAILEAYKQLYVKNGKLMDPVPNLGEDNFTGEDRYLGRTVAFRLDRFLIAFNGFNERQKLIDTAVAADQRILGTIRKELLSADKAAARQPAQ